MAIKYGPTIAVCDQCGKEEEFDRHYRTVGWIEITVDKEADGDKGYDYDENVFCCWGCARDFCDDKHAKLEF